MTRDDARRVSLRTTLACCLCTFVGGALLGGVVEPPWSDDRAPQKSSALAEETPSQVVTPKPLRKGQALRLPVTLEIPAIDVSTPLLQLGLQPDHTVEVPDDPALAGWFRKGPEPGKRGSSVILGHVDSDEGPAVFARLKQLEPGDEVEVRRADGTILTFAVRRSVIHPAAEFPAQRVYAAARGRRLNLVTCDGPYDADRGGYQANLVVYTHLAGMDPPARG